MVQSAVDRKPKPVRIQLLGDAGVGKTSLILTLVSEEFFDARCLSSANSSTDDAGFVRHSLDSSLPGLVHPNDQCERVSSTACEDIFIPAEITITRTPCIICDLVSSCSDETIMEAVRLADVICIVYSCASEQSKQSIAERWIPLIVNACKVQHLARTDGSTREASLKPAIIVASKCDVSERCDSGILADSHIDALIAQHKWIHCRIECSALRMHNIAELFYYAQKVVLYPVDPLYDCSPPRLHPDFEFALRHIFHILDRRQMGRLDDDALNRLQQLAVSWGYWRSKSHEASVSPTFAMDRSSHISHFATKLTTDDFTHLKSLLCNEANVSVTTTNVDQPNCGESCVAAKHLDQNEITESGFICLFNLLLQRDLSETAWAFLRVFFDSKFRFHCPEEELLRQLETAASKRSVPFIVELTDDALLFLRDLYRRHNSAQRKIFSWPSPQSINASIFKFLRPPPNHHELICNVRCARVAEPPNTEYIGEEQFLLWWMYHIYDDPPKTLLWLGQLGFDFWMTDIDDAGMRCPSAFAVRQKTPGNRYVGSAVVSTIFAEPPHLAKCLLRDMVNTTVPGGHSQHWLIWALDKCEHCSKHMDRTLILRSFDRRCNPGDICSTDWISSSHLLVLLCDLLDKESCQRVLKLCYTLCAPQNKTNTSGESVTYRSSREKRVPSGSSDPPLLLIAVNGDLCEESNPHLQAIMRMKSICPNVLGDPVVISSKSLLSGRWADCVFEHIKSCVLDNHHSFCTSANLGSHASGWSILSIPATIMSSTTEYLSMLAMKFRFSEQPRVLLDRLRIYTMDERVFYNCCWYMMISTSAAVGCIAMILLKHLGRKPLSSTGITRSVFI